MAHPILFLWSHPRSMSTATERIMRERGDCTCFHEPFMLDYYLHRAVREMPHLDESAEAADYATTRGRILAAAKDGPVFVKDMSYYVVPRIFEDRDFAMRLRDVFLIRDPRRSIASFAKLDPEVTCEEIGIEAQWRHFAFLRDQMGKTPMVIEAEAVARDPEGVIGRVWDHAGLPFRAEAFDWQKGEVPEDWKIVEGWHGKVLASDGIRQDTRDPQAVFDKAAAALPRLEGMLAHHWPYYERLRNAAGPG